MKTFSQWLLTFEGTGPLGKFAKSVRFYPPAQPNWSRAQLAHHLADLGASEDTFEAFVVMCLAYDSYASECCANTTSGVNSAA